MSRRGGAGRGLSHERDVSLRSGSRLHEALRGVGMEVDVRDADAELLPRCSPTGPTRRRSPCTAAAARTARSRGCSRWSASLRRHAAEALPARLGEEHREGQARRAPASPRPAWISLSHSTFRDLGASAVIDALVDHLGLPLMVKPQHGGSALGATVVATAEDLPAALVGCFAYGEIVVVERFVDGVELAVTVIEDGDGAARPAGGRDRRRESGVFDYESRYTAGLTTYFTPARLDRRGRRRGRRPGDRRAPRCSACGTCPATDAIVAADGTVHFLEVERLARA